MDDKNFVKELTKMDDNFADWYTDIILKAELVDYAPVKGFMVIRPYGYALWENIQKVLDNKFKETGHKNAYFPLLIPESLLNKEKDHVAGFAPEVAWVTQGGENKLQERLCVRPTSETIICTMYSKWIKSHRDLPLLINQWANVVRWEKTTRPFLRTSEFLWQEGHTLHSTADEAIEETLKMHKIYADFCEEYLAIPVIKGQKSEKEKFAGAESTYTIEALMHDGKALQSGTSHYFGNHFAKAFDIKFQNKEGKEEYAYQTSWGMSTRIIGGIIMTHGDDRGLKLPPNIAPIQVVIVPIAAHKEGVLDKVNDLKTILSNKFRVELDDREGYSTGYKFNHWELRGVPVRIEIGPKDIENNSCVVFRRDTFEKQTVKLDELNEYLEKLLVEIQDNMLNMAKENTKNHTFEARSLEEYIDIFKTKQGFVKMMWCGNVECEDKIKELTASTIRCIPFEEDHLGDKCAICGKDAKHMVYTARQY
ncbi:MAG: proline--tRNA ligase [Clostridia bacterium]|jgi:prolyl-tRNA synthetase|nr:proline--tRNA ligase [Clostridia bacterium]